MAAMLGGVEVEVEGTLAPALALVVELECLKRWGSVSLLANGGRVIVAGWQLLHAPRPWLCCLSRTCWLGRVAKICLLPPGPSWPSSLHPRVRRVNVLGVMYKAGPVLQI